MEIGLLGAFIGGVLMLLSPCSVMLLPAFFSYAFTNPATLLARTGIFYLGLITTLVPLGVLAGSLGALVNQHRYTFVTIASIIVIAFGVIMLANLPIPMLNRRQSSATSNASVYALGTMFGLAGVCAGPLLGVVLTFAALSRNALYGGVIVLVFAAGMALPLFLMSLLWSRWPMIRQLARPREVTLGRWRNTWTGIIGGVLTIAAGVFMLLTRGGSTLPGVLGASQQAELENWVLQAFRAIPDLVVVLVVLAAAALGWLVLRQRPRPRQSDSSTNAAGRRLSRYRRP